MYLPKASLSKVTEQQSGFPWLLSEGAEGWGLFLTHICSAPGKSSEKQMSGNPRVGPSAFLL